MQTCTRVGGGEGEKGGERGVYMLESVYPATNEAIVTSSAEQRLAEKESCRKTWRDEGMVNN